MPRPLIESSNALKLAHAKPPIRSSTGTRKMGRERGDVTGTMGLFCGDRTMGIKRTCHFDLQGKLGSLRIGSCAACVYCCCIRQRFLSKWW